MERVRAPLSTIDGSQVPSLAPLESLPAPLIPPLEQLALTARATPGQAGREALTSLHAALAKLQPAEENGATLLRLLDDGAFHELRADNGQATREVAVETLLRLGYPWALRIHPDELAWYRRAQATSRQLKYLILFGVLAIGGLAAAFLAGFF